MLKSARFCTFLSDNKILSIRSLLHSNGGLEELDLTSMIATFLNTYHSGCTNAENTIVSLEEDLAKHSTLKTLILTSMKLLRICFSFDKAVHWIRMD